MEKKGVGRPRDGNPEETRRQILAAAGEAFSEAGYVGATTRAVASRAGVNVATLHYHFGSKEGLYRAVLAEASRHALPPVPAGEPAAVVAALVAALFAHTSERPARARLALLDDLAGPPSPDGESRDERVRWLAEALRPLMAGGNGAPHPLGAEETARTIVAFVDAALATRTPRTASIPVVGAAGPEPPGGSAHGRDPHLGAVVSAALRLTALG
jgi:AcrR family transcriptional regulator